MNKSFVKYILLFLSIILIIIGVLNGEVKSVLLKAVSICLECIGIG